MTKFLGKVLVRVNPCKRCVGGTMGREGVTGDLVCMQCGMRELGVVRVVVEGREMETVKRVGGV